MSEARVVGMSTIGLLRWSFATGRTIYSIVRWHILLPKVTQQINGESSSVDGEKAMELDKRAAKITGWLEKLAIYIYEMIRKHESHIITNTFEWIHSIFVYIWFFARLSYS